MAAAVQNGSARVVDGDLMLAPGSSAGSGRFDHVEVGCRWTRKPPPRRTITWSARVVAQRKAAHQAAAPVGAHGAVVESEGESPPRPGSAGFPPGDVLPGRVIRPPPAGRGRPAIRGRWGKASRGSLQVSGLRLADPYGAVGGGPGKRRFPGRAKQGSPGRLRRAPGAEQMPGKWPKRRSRQGRRRHSSLAATSAGRGGFPEMRPVGLPHQGAAPVVRGGDPIRRPGSDSMPQDGGSRCPVTFVRYDGRASVPGRIGTRGPVRRPFPLRPGAPSRPSSIPLADRPVEGRRDRGRRRSRDGPPDRRGAARSPKPGWPAGERGDDQMGRKGHLPRSPSRRCRSTLTEWPRDVRSQKEALGQDC